MSNPAARPEEPVLLDVPRFLQPDDLTCGPTCLAQVYRYYGIEKTVAQVIGETARNPDGGTQAVYLGISAMENGLKATIYSYNLRVFDPTWRGLSEQQLIRKLRRRERAVKSTRLQQSLVAYRKYLSRGGYVRFEELEPRLLHRLLAGGKPVLTGLSATYLYRTPREFREEYDDIRGEPAGHFVVICGYYPKSDRFVVRDPAKQIPFSRTGRYSVPSHRLISAILLGAVTYDAVLLVLEDEPPWQRKRKTS